MIGQHERVILQFSGGKDSTALLWLARPYLDRIEVVHVDTGGMFPHMREHVRRAAEMVGASLTVLRPEIPVMEYTEAHGLPADVSSTWNFPMLAWLTRDGAGQLLQPPAACCNAMMWQPMMAYLKASPATLVLRGNKASDAKRGKPDGYVEDGMQFDCPLWHWTDRDVMAYLEREGAPIPEHYGEVNDGLDCWGCTGHLNTEYGGAKLRYVREHHPDLWPVLKDRLDRMRGAVAKDWAMVERAIEGAN